HPLNVSTVLYPTQRMAQVAAPFCVAGLWAYMAIRSRIVESPSPSGWLALAFSMVAVTFLGIQGKQNAAVLPGLCLVVELAYFRPLRHWTKPLWLIYGLSIALPVTGGLAYLVYRPDVFAYGYGEFEFNAWQRLLSEARVLVEYLR